MAITLSQDTLAMFEQRANEYCAVNVDEFIQSMLLDKYPSFEVDMDKLDPETRAAIEEADAQEDIPWEEAKTRIHARFGKA
jgi:hypothetical protein